MYKLFDTDLNQPVKDELQQVFLNQLYLQKNIHI